MLELRELVHRLDLRLQMFWKAHKYLVILHLEHLHLSDQALKKHGLLKGLLIGVKRILRCHPIKKLGGGEGIDYVPSINKDFKNGQ